ncbi:MAG: metal ABC transporter permease [Chitinispirillaceae bacterium]|jgi:zinc transport system permease protein|nr:metal ABC transporter permease [Chitinispirillaceae bacterium]
MTDLLQHEFMRNAVCAGLLASVACGIVGAFVVVNRLSFLAGGVAHAAYGGLGISVLLKIPPMAATIPFSLASSFLMGYVSRRRKERADTVIGVMWALGMAIGIVCIDLKPGYYIDLMSYLFGSILAVSDSDLMLMAGLDLVIIATVVALYKELLGMSYDEEFALVSGVPVPALYYVMLLLIALTVIMLIRVVGLILVIALFTIPASIAEMFTRDLRRIMVVATVLGALFTVSGLLLSYYFNLTSGATIILVAGACYGVAYGVTGGNSLRR